ncbi:MAG: Fic family protein [Candidatus Aminicenantales bacterium]
MLSEQKEILPRFKSIDLRMVYPAFESDLTDLIVKLEYLRRLRAEGTTPGQTFFQIKAIFHILESIGSARIEGNRTTVIEYIDQKMEKKAHHTESFKEIENMEIALKFIDENIASVPIDRAFVSELHRRTVAELSEEGSRAPGSYREFAVGVRGSELVPPPTALVASLMDELFRFISAANAPKYDLIKIALSHHRFEWIHPFDNGNGRTGRLLTYAMMVKFGFNVNLARIVNPAAIFCYDRDKYNMALARADQGDDEGLLEWAKYMLAGLQRELDKTDKLTDYEYLKKEILLPAIDFSLDKNILNEVESKILRLAIEKKGITNTDIRTILSIRHRSDISHLIRDLLDKNYLVPIGPGKRKYVISFQENRLVRGVISALGKAGFLPTNVAGVIS